MAVNLRAPFVLLQESIAPMRARGGGSIVNIGSVLAYVGEPKLGAYSVSKGALMTLTRNAASLLNRDRIRVNQINVGWTLTEGERRVKREQEGEGRGDEWIAEAIATRPFGRMLAPADIAYAAAYFASDESECVTGSVLDLEQYPPGATANS
jgi:NAD(P)-dependent dehydrogenase (short-subunit alcohol dehydrogenase family)